MKHLQDILEGILDNDLERAVDKQVSSDFGDWIIEYWKDIKWQPGGSLYNKNCWYDKDRDTTYKKYEDFGFEVKKRGKKWAAARKATEKLILDKNADVTIICVSYHKTLDVRHIGIGNPAQKDALIMQRVFCPYNAKLSDQEQRLTLWCESIMSKAPSGNVWWDIAGEGNSRVKKDYYVIPGHYWEKIKKAIIL